MFEAGCCVNLTEKAWSGIMEEGNGPLNVAGKGPKNTCCGC